MSVMERFHCTYVHTYVRTYIRTYIHTYILVYLSMCIYLLVLLCFSAAFSRQLYQKRNTFLIGFLQWVQRRVQVERRAAAFEGVCVCGLAYACVFMYACS